MRLLQVTKKSAVLDLLREQFGEYYAGAANTELVDVEAAVGRTLADAVFAPENMPEFRRSTMDGYAVIAADVAGCSEAVPAFLRVVGTSIMGSQAEIDIEHGQALQVATGAMLPDSADAVVMVEYTEIIGQDVAVFRPAALRDYILAVGDDIKVSEKLFTAGETLAAHQVGVLAMLGCGAVMVKKRPKFGIISTGDELVDIHARPEPGQVRDVNSINLAVFCRKAGCEVIFSRRVRDNDQEIRTALQTALASCDVVLISGGSSVGEQDCTAEIINSLGGPGVLVHGVALKPGKPTIVARIDNKAIFGLPGHPAACVMAFVAIVQPFIQEQILGAIANKNTATLPASAGFQLHCGQGRDVLQLVSLKIENGSRVAYPLPGKSGMLSAMAVADGYVEIPLDKEGICFGDQLEVKLF